MESNAKAIELYQAFCVNAVKSLDFSLSKQFRNSFFFCLLLLLINSIGFLFFFSLELPVNLRDLLVNTRSLSGKTHGPNKELSLFIYREMFTFLAVKNLETMPLKWVLVFFRIRDVIYNFLRSDLNQQQDNAFGWEHRRVY